MPKVGQVVTLAVSHEGTEHTVHLKWLKSGRWTLWSEECNPPCDPEKLQAIFKLAVKKAGDLK
jgi:hypothetical protein